MVKSGRLFLLFLILLICFCGCSKPDQQVSEQEIQSAPTTASIDTNKEIESTSPSNVEVEPDAKITETNTINLNPIINGTEYQLSEVALGEGPFGKPLKSEENYYNEIWAGSWWLEESYDGATIIYALNKETGEKYPYQIEITKPNSENGLQVYTDRNAAVGDSKERILSLYPEIDPEEQRQLNGTGDQLSLWINYLYLEFYFENDIVTKMVMGVYID